MDSFIWFSFQKKTDNSVYGNRSFTPISHTSEDGSVSTTDDKSFLIDDDTPSVNTDDSVLSETSLSAWKISEIDDEASASSKCPPSQIAVCDRETCYDRRNKFCSVTGFASVLHHLASRRQGKNTTNIVTFYDRRYMFHFIWLTR